MTYEGSRFAEEHGFDEERCVVSHDRSGALGGYKARDWRRREKITLVKRALVH